jgi:hypothetical protein
MPLEFADEREFASRFCQRNVASRQRTGRLVAQFAESFFLVKLHAVSDTLGHSQQWKPNRH